MAIGRKAALVLCCTGLLAGVGACGGSDDDDSSEGSSTLELWARSDNASFLPKVVDEFNDSQSKVRVKLTLVPAPQVAQKFSAAAARGSGPDVVSVDMATVPQYGSAGWFADLTDRARKLPYYDKLSPSHVRLATVDDKVVALPLTADVSVLYYNKELFEQAGLDPDAPPQTWGELRTAASKIRALGDDYYGYYFSGPCGGCMAFTFLPYVWANGGDVLEGTEPDVRATLSPNPQLESALKLFRELWTSGVVPPQAKTDTGADQFGPFFSGKVGMFVNGTFPVGTLKKEHPDIDFGIAPIPGTDGGSGSYTGGDSIAITKQAADDPAAWEFVSWMTSEGQTALAKAGVLPTRSDIADSVYAEQDPRFQVFADALEIGKTPNSKNVAPIFFDNNGPWSTMVQKAIFDGDAGAAMAAAQSDVATKLTE